MQNLHTHTCFSDGADTPAQLVEAALALGMEAIGFSDHSFTPFDTSYCLSRENEDAYIRTVRQLQEQYTGRIRILLGIEEDYFSGRPRGGYDFVIGSVHYVKTGDIYLPVDESPEILREAVSRHFGGDFYAFAERYWQQEADLVKRTGCSIIGHVDLIRKFNRDGSFFDESHPRYRAAAFAALDALLEEDIPFEINTGAISRGWQDSPYPSAELMAYLRERGARFVLSSDCHSRENLCYGFERYAGLISG